MIHQRGNGMPASDTTQLLLELGTGKSQVADELMPRVYDELKSMAHRHLFDERGGHTLNATALVHEAYLKLIDQKRVSWQNRAHFLAIASRAMRRILLNYAESRRAEKRGGGERLITLCEENMASDMREDELLALDELLNNLAKTHERASSIVEAKFFGGLSQEEIAEVLGLSVRTVRRDWRFARAWLKHRLKPSS